MKARDAARIFEILDDDILIPVASGMRTQALAGILAELSAERAKALTIALANRESPPTVPAAALAPAAQP
jgi:flagellar motility protein MotE (MotC chaperone)